MNAQQLKARIFEAINRNPGRDHEAVEFAIQLSVPQQQAIVPIPAVIVALQELMAEGKVQQRNWNDGTTVYGLVAA
jgi:hypothetical protein